MDVHMIDVWAGVSGVSFLAIKLLWCSMALQLNGVGYSMRHLERLGHQSSKSRESPFNYSDATVLSYTVPTGFLIVGYLLYVTYVYFDDP